MKRFLFLILCLFPLLTWASSPQKLISGTASGTTQLRLSTVAGTAFIDGDGTVPVTSFLGEKLQVCDSAKKCIDGIIKAAGGGETTTEKITAADDRTLDSDTTWWSKTSAAVTIAGGVVNLSSAPTNHAVYRAALIGNPGILYKSQFDVVSISAGGFKAIYGLVEGTPRTLTGTYTEYNTNANPTSGYTFQFGANGTSTGTIDNLSFKSVDAPSATGATIVSTVGGTTYNWSHQDSGFNPNSATWTWKIISTNQLGKQIASGTVSASDVKLATVDGGAMVEITGVDLSTYAGVDTQAGVPTTTNLQLWLKADAGCYTDAAKSTACASDADKVYTWADQSGSGNDAVQATEANRPLWKTNIVGTLPEIRFDGSDDGLLLPTGFANGWTAFTMYLVHNTTTGSNKGVFGPSTSYETGLEIITNTSSFPTIFRVNNNTKHSGASGTGVLWPSGSLIMNTFYADSASTKVAKDGVRFGLASSTGISALNFNGVYSIGKYAGETYCAQLKAYEILIYNVAHDDLTRSQIERYLAGKWGISYQPTVIGNPPAKYILALYDSSNRMAYAHVGGPGGGEGLGDELITQWVNDYRGSPNYYETLDVSSPPNINSAINTNGAGVCNTNSIGIAGKLYKYTYSVTVNSGATPSMRAAKDEVGYQPILTCSSSPCYVTNPSTLYFQDVVVSSSDHSATTSIKNVTDIAATGVHLHSTPNATDRKMAYKATGFDPNAVTSYKLYRCY